MAAVDHPRALVVLAGPIPFGLGDGHERFAGVVAQRGEFLGGLDLGDDEAWHDEGEDDEDGEEDADEEGE